MHYHTIMANLHPSDAIIILGYPAKSSNRPGPILRSRLDKGIALYKQNAANTIILTGSAVSNINVEADVMATYCMRQGIPADDLILERHALNTYENALYTRKIMKLHKMRTGILVSSNFHIPRAKYIFRHFAKDLQFEGAQFPKDAFPLLKYYFLLRERLIMWYLCTLGDKKQYKVAITSV